MTRGGYTVEHLAELLIRAERYGLPLHIEDGILSAPDADGCCENCRDYVDLSDLFELVGQEEQWREAMHERSTGDLVRSRRVADFVRDFAKTCWRPV